MPEGMMLMAPTMVLPFLKSRLISWPGKLRMGMEMFIPKAEGNGDETLGGFVRRRLGNEALNKIAGPLMGGIHAADPERLSLKSTFPMFQEMEKNHGSLLRGMMKRSKRRAPGSRASSMFMSLQGGLQQLADAMIARFPQHSLRLGRSVLSVSRHGDRYKVALSDGACLLADDVVFATPSYVTADLVQQIDPALASKLRAIRYVSTATVSLGFRRSDIQHPMRGAGFIVPKSEGRRITACSWSSEKFAHRAPEDCILLRVFIGGALAEDLAEQDETSLIALALDELRTIMGISATPVLAKSYRWPKANPQYDLDHALRVEDIERTLADSPGLHLAGAAYHGAGIPDCIMSGMQAARSIVTERINAHSAYQDEHLPAYIGR
jgi:oxygen-dependent protoporphyrinogen oxidase